MRAANPVDMSRPQAFIRNIARQALASGVSEIVRMQFNPPSETEDMPAVTLTGAIAKLWTVEIPKEVHKSLELHMIINLNSDYADIWAEKV